MKQSPKPLLVIGNLVLDIRFEGLRDLPEGERSVRSTGAGMDMGGCAGNTARSMAVIGTPVILSSRIGKDEAGEKVANELKSRGVGLDLVEDSSSTTGMTAVLLFDEGRKRSFIYHPGVNSHICVEDISSSTLEKISWLHIAGFFNTDLLAKDSARLLRHAKERGIPTSIGLAWSSTGDWAWIKPCYPFLDLLLMNQEEARSLTGKISPEESARLLSEKEKMLVVVTEGEKGAYAAHLDWGVCSAPAQVVDVVDSTGAGDSFNAGCLSWIYQNGGALPKTAEQGREMLNWGAVAASLSVSGPAGLGQISQERFLDGLADGKH